MRLQQNNKQIRKNLRVLVGMTEVLSHAFCTENDSLKRAKRRKLRT